MRAFEHRGGALRRVKRRLLAAAFCAGACAARKASSSTSDGCSGATGRDTITLPTSWSDLTSAA